MASVNRVTILGNVGQAPELRYTPNGAAVCNLSIATSRKWTNKATGEKQEETEWHRVVFYDKLAEIVGQYVTKGSPLYVEGRLKTRKWQDKDGVEKYTTEIVAQEMQLLASKDRDAEPRPRVESGKPPPAQRPPAQPAQKTAFDDMDDDIPF